MGGFFGVASKSDCVFDLFFGTDYHSHLGTKRGGMAVYGEGGFNRAIHNIQNAPFRTKFERDVEEMKGNFGIGCISDTEPQPLIVRSHLGNYAITTVGRINNVDALVKKLFDEGSTHFMESSGGDISPTELTAALINRKGSIAEGIRYAQEQIDGSMAMMLITADGLYVARDRMGRMPLHIGKKKGALCASLESFAYLNLGYSAEKELGPGEIVLLTPDSVTTLMPPLKEMKICTFLWAYFGYPPSIYEGTSVETMRYRCGEALARHDAGLEVDSVAGVPDSGLAHAIGYAAQSGVPFTRPFIKYTPTFSRSFMPSKQSQRKMIAHMKLIPVHDLIRDKRLVLIDDSIVRGTQLRETTDFLYNSGAKEVHVRTGCPPILFGCKYLNFSANKSELDLIARRVIERLEGEHDKNLDKYSDPDAPEYAAMVEEVRKEMHFTTLKYLRLDDIIAATGLPADKLCTYCWDGKE